MWPFAKRIKPAEINLPDWCLIEYPKQICETLHRLYMRAGDSRLISGLNPDGILVTIGKLGRLEALPSRGIIEEIDKHARLYASLSKSSVPIHPNVRSFLNSPEHIDTYVLNTLFRKLSGPRLEGGSHLFKSGIVMNLFESNAAMRVAGFDRSPVDTISNQTFDGPYAAIKKELSVWSMAVLPLAYEYFDAMKIADEYARVRALESDVPAMCVHPMCLKVFKVDKRISDLFKFYVVDGGAKLIATFCCDAHASAAKDNGSVHLAEHVKFVEGLNKTANYKIGSINKSMYLNSWDEWKERDNTITYVEYPMCRQPFVAELKDIIASVCDDSNSPTNYPKLYTPLEICNTITECTIGELESWRQFFMDHGLNPDGPLSAHGREVLQKMRVTWAKDKDFGFFSLEENFKKNY